ncbi:DNA adenine methylase [Microbacterium sp. GXS0129]|uniref:DNA adenine methylase n=1 Tax=Microbacterium sp. GXS0129 TaxID=3377836 RepID=UPI00383ADAC5
MFEEMPADMLISSPAVEPQLSTLAPAQQAWSDQLALRAATPLSAEPRPFLRWAGSKQRLLAQLVPHIPTFTGRFIEPFLGAGAMFFLLDTPNAILSDKIEPLVSTYDVVARRPEELLSHLENMNVLDKDFYYRIRKQTPTDEVEAAARFIYLNRAGWNGLYRVNAKGKFNVPYGRPRSGTIIDRANLLKCSTLLSGASLAVSDFEATARQAGPGDLVYFDPPYVTGHNNNGFVDYNEDLFAWRDQERLAGVARELRDSGVHVMVSNADHSAIRELYSTFNYAQVSRRSALASSVTKRTTVTEAVFYS